MSSLGLHKFDPKFLNSLQIALECRPINIADSLAGRAFGKPSLKYHHPPHPPGGSQRGFQVARIPLLQKI